MATTRELIDHWGIPEKDMREMAATIIEKARDENRPKCGDRHQYDAWTRTLIAVVTEAA
jgi:hypothetical protein